jgi:hypothetical protein
MSGCTSTSLFLSNRSTPSVVPPSYSPIQACMHLYALHTLLLVSLLDHRYPIFTRAPPSSSSSSSSSSPSSCFVSFSSPLPILLESFKPLPFAYQRSILFLHSFYLSPSLMLGCVASPGRNASNPCATVVLIDVQPRTSPHRRSGPGAWFSSPLVCSFARRCLVGRGLLLGPSRILGPS